MQNKVAFQDSKTFSMIEDLIYKKSKLQTEDTKLLVDVTFMAYKYLVKSHSSCWKDLNIFCGRLDERLESIYTAETIGGLNGTKGIYVNKEIRLKSDILKDRHLLMLTYAHELTHCLSESKNNTGIINSAKPFKTIKRNFSHHFLNEMETDYISIKVLEEDFKLIDREFTYKFYISHNRFLDVSLFYQGDVYPEFSIFAGVINIILGGLTDIYLEDDRNYEKYIQNDDIKYLRRYVRKLEKSYSKFARKRKKIHGKEFYRYKYFIRMYEAYKEIVFMYIAKGNISSVQGEKLLEQILRNPVYIDGDKHSLNERFAIAVKEKLNNAEEAE